MTRELIEAERLRLRILAQRQATQRQDMVPVDDFGLPKPPTGGSSANQENLNAAQMTGRAALQGLGNGLSFGFGDEINGVGAGLYDAATGGSFVDGYTQERDEIRAAQDVIQGYSPFAYGAGNVAGAMVPAVASLPLATGRTGLNTFFRGMGLGAVEGALHGGGNADGDDLSDEILGGAAIGGVLGGAAPVAVSAARSIKNAIKDPATGVIDSLLGRASANKANRAIARAVRESGRPDSEVIELLAAAAREGQTEYRLVDALGPAGQRQASGVARNGGDAARELTEFLERRQLDQGDRVGEFIEDAFETKGRTANQTSDDLKKARTEAADVNYDAAREGAEPVDVRGALSVIDSRLGQISDAAGTGFNGDSIDAAMARYRSRLAANRVPSDIDAMELSDFDRVLGVKQSVQDDIGAAIRAGRNNEARELRKILTALDGALESSSSGYRVANDSFRDASSVIAALDQGAAMSRPGRAADNVQIFNRMTPDQQAAARIGYGSDLLGKIEGIVAPTSNRARLLTSTKREAEAEAMAIDPQRFARQLARENEMWQTQNRALGGSKTADNQRDLAAMDGDVSGALDVARSAATGRFGDALARVGRMVGPMARGQNEATRQLIGRALMSSNPQEALAPILRQELLSKKKSRVIEALLRQPTTDIAEGSLDQ